MKKLLIIAIAGLFLVSGCSGKSESTLESSEISPISSSSSSKSSVSSNSSQQSTTKKDKFIMSKYFVGPPDKSRAPEGFVPSPMVNYYYSIYKSICTVKKEYSSYNEYKKKVRAMLDKADSILPYSAEATEEDVKTA